jgi:hypothetical protein
VVGLLPAAEAVAGQTRAAGWLSKHSEEVTGVSVFTWVMQANNPDGFPGGETATKQRPRRERGQANPLRSVPDVEALRPRLWKFEKLPKSE